MNIQIKKGVVELCVLALLHERDCYGYELVESVSAHIEISEGTIYPLLRRFRQEGYVESYLKESQAGPPRKYYQLTIAGERAYREQLAEWRSFQEGVNALLGGVENA